MKNLTIVEFPKNYISCCEDAKKFIDNDTYKNLFWARKNSVAEIKYMQLSIEFFVIKFCPFCGIKLDKVENDTNS